MINFKNINNSYGVNVAGQRTGYATVKGDSLSKMPVKTDRPGEKDKVEISSDAVLKSKLSGFKTVLAQEINTCGPQRMAALKEKYAGDACPVGGSEIADKILDRAKGLGLSYE